MPLPRSRTEAEEHDRRIAMSEENPASVFVAESLQVAEAVVRLLAAEGIVAEVIPPAPKTASEPITGITDMVESDEFDVRVTDPTKAADATKFMGSVIATAALQAIREKRSKRTGTVSVACEECGKTSEWPASSMGTTETCPHCTAYMDIPDPDDQWAGVDFGDPEEEDEEGQEK
jgi:hypothetical protein